MLNQLRQDLKMLLWRLDEHFRIFWDHTEWKEHFIDYPFQTIAISSRLRAAYSLYSSIAEKFEVMVSLGYDNSRFKDFYDIYVNAQKYDFDGQTLVEAIKETFDHRGTSLHTIVAFNPEYSDDAIRLSRWKSFVKKKKVSLDVTLPETIETIKQFLLPLIDVIETGRSFDSKWDSREQQWNDNCQ